MPCGQRVQSVRVVRERVGSVWFWVRSEPDLLVGRAGSSRFVGTGAIMVKDVVRAGKLSGLVFIHEGHIQS